MSNGGLLLISGKIEFFMGGDILGDFYNVEHDLPVITVAAHFQKNPLIMMSHPGVGLRQMDGSAEGDRHRQQGRGRHLLQLDAQRLGLQGRERQALQLQLRHLHLRPALDPAGLRDVRALCGREAGPFQAQRVPALRLRLFQLRDDDHRPQGSRRKEARPRAALRRRLDHRLVPLSLRRQQKGQRRASRKTTRR